jgi:DNA polymerase III epsilon subunit-like protein
MSDLVFMDTETTGHEDGDVIQVYVLNPNGEHFHARIRPDRPILAAATSIHGITNATAATFPPKEQIAVEFQRYVRDVLPKGVIVVGHNIEFDVKGVQRTLHVVPQRTICTLRMVRKLIDRDVIGGHRLDHVHVFLYPDRLQDLLAKRASHDARHDCELTKDVYEGLLTRASALPGFNSDPDSVLKWVAAPMKIDKWPFGKFKGQPLDIDPGYASWYARQKDPDPDIIYSLDLLRKQRAETGRTSRYTGS